MSKRNIIDLKSIGPCAFLSSYEHSKFDLAGLYFSFQFLTKECKELFDNHISFLSQKDIKQFVMKE